MKIFKSWPLISETLGTFMLIDINNYHITINLLHKPHSLCGKSEKGKENAKN